MNKILELIEKAGDILSKTACDVTSDKHIFISISEDNSECVMLTHSTGSDKKGRVPSGSKDEVLQWFICSNYSVRDKKLIVLDMSDLVENKASMPITGGGCIDCSQKYHPVEKEVIASVSDIGFQAIMGAFAMSTLRGIYWDKGFKDVYNQYCYKIFADNRLHDLQQNKNFIKYLDITDQGIFIEWNGEDYSDKARQEIERLIATPHYHVYPASDARAKGSMFFRIGK